jgi:hypothetical protein
MSKEPTMTHADAPRSAVVEHRMVLRPANFDQLAKFADMASRSALVPKDYQNKPENIMLAVQMGSEIGLAPMQALQNIAVVNGRPAVWGDAMLALCKCHPNWAGIAESIQGDGDDMRAVCKIERKGDNPVTVTFTVADAKKAGLWGKTGPWQQYPKRMLQMRARGFALRDAFPDALKGLISAEEARDIPTDDFKGPTITGTAEPGPTTRDELNASVPLNHSPPADDGMTPRELTDDILAKIMRAPDEDGLHLIVGSKTINGMRDKLKAFSADLDQEITDTLNLQFQRFRGEEAAA